MLSSLQDGAETGYGAKAQEVLGQVKGRCVFMFTEHWPSRNFRCGVIAFFGVLCGDLPKKGNKESFYGVLFFVFCFVGEWDKELFIGLIN